jgi:hypothetical protein
MLGHGLIRPFVELKGGFVNYSFSKKPASFETFVSSVEDLRVQNWNAALMPAVGLEGRIEPGEYGWMRGMRCTSIMGRIIMQRWLWGRLCGFSIRDGSEGSLGCKK